MAAKKTTAKRVTSAGKKAAQSRRQSANSVPRKTVKKRTARKSVAKKKSPVKKTAVSKKKASAKTSAPKSKTAAGKKASTKKKAAAGRKAVAKKKVVSAGKKAPVKKKVAARKAPAKKKTAARKAPAKKKTAARKAPVKKKKAVPRKVAPKKRAAGKKAKADDPLAPRTKKRSMKLNVLLPGRKRANHQMAKTRGYRALTTRQKETYRRQLIELRERIYSQITALKNDSLTRSDEVNIEEDGTDAFDRQFALNLVSSENEALIAIDAALQRIDDGTFGKCQECNGGIEKARLKAIPFVENCITCQSEVEKHRSGYRPPHA